LPTSDADGAKEKDKKKNSAKTSDASPQNSGYGGSWFGLSSLSLAWKYVVTDTKRDKRSFAIGLITVILVVLFLR
jgi:hypothetical protein